VLVPALLLAAYCIALKNRFPRLQLLVVLVAAVFGLSDLIQRTSKYTFAMLGLLFYITHLILGWKIPRKYLTVGGSTILVFLLLQPLFLSYRVNRINSRDDTLGAIVLTYKTGVEEINAGFGGMLYRGICAAIERLPGIDVVGQLVLSGVTPQG